MYVHSIGQRFEIIAAHHGERPALRHDDGTVTTYRALQSRARDLARRFHAANVPAGRPVALLHGKTEAAYAAMLAVMAIAAPYCCLDGRLPVDRQRSILQQLRPSLILASGVGPDEIARVQSAAREVDGDLQVVDLDDGQLTKAEPYAPYPTCATIGSDIAYIMFTSGSTGRPKGVAIAHASVLNFADWCRVEYAIVPNDTLSSVNPMHFDNSVFDTYAALLNGASVAPLPRTSTDAIGRLSRVVGLTNSSILFAVPSFYIYAAKLGLMNRDTFPHVRTIIFGGEGYPKPSLLTLFLEFRDQARLVNVYGPSECTCICSSYTITPADFIDLAALAPLGLMAPNFRGLVLNGDDPAPDGEVGELCLVGPNVGLGYYNDAERTAAAFGVNPLRADISERMYRTGDLVQYDKSRNLFLFVGRKDHQIKHLGHRVELGDIEVSLASIDSVDRAAAIYVKDSSLSGRIVVFAVTNDDSVSADDILQAARPRLPDYMRPSRVLLLEELPLNANGKVDRPALLRAYIDLDNR